jgi:putative DNA primase/helicase
MRQGIARLAIGNHRVVFSISLEFAGPRLELLGIEGFGAHMYGDGSVGKTTTIQAGASAWGKPKKDQDGFLFFGSATENSLEGVAEICNGTGCHLDEIGMVTGIHDVIFKLAEGTGRSRLGKNAELREPKHWHTIVQTSANYSIDTLVQDENLKKQQTSKSAVSGGGSVDFVAAGS